MSTRLILNNSGRIRPGPARLGSARLGSARGLIRPTSNYAAESPGFWWRGHVHTQKFIQCHFLWCCASILALNRPIIQSEAAKYSKVIPKRGKPNLQEGQRQK